MAYSVVQHTGASSPTTIAFGSALTAGNAAFVGISYNQAQTLTGISGSNNGAYARAGTAFANANSSGQTLEIWYKASVAAGAETISYSGLSGTPFTIYLAEVSGLGSSPTLDVQLKTSGSTAMSWSISPTAADFVYVLLVNGSGFPNSGLTNLTFLDSLSPASAHYWTSTTGAGSITCGDAGPTNWGVNVVAFKVATGGNVTENVTGNLVVTATQGAQVGIPAAPLTTGVLSLTGRVIVQGFTPPPSGGTTVTNPPWWWAWFK